MAEIFKPLAECRISKIREHGGIHFLRAAAVKHRQIMNFIPFSTWTWTTWHDGNQIHHVANKTSVLLGQWQQNQSCQPHPIESHLCQSGKNTDWCIYEQWPTYYSLKEMLLSIEFQWEVKFEWPECIHQQKFPMLFSCFKHNISVKYRKKKQGKFHVVTMIKADSINDT